MDWKQAIPNLYRDWLERLISADSFQPILFPLTVHEQLLYTTASSSVIRDEQRSDWLIARRPMQLSEEVPRADPL